MKVRTVTWGTYLTKGSSESVTCGQEALEIRPQPRQFKALLTHSPPPACPLSFTCWPHIHNLRPCTESHLCHWLGLNKQFNLLLYFFFYGVNCCFTVDAILLLTGWHYQHFQVFFKSMWWLHLCTLSFTQTTWHTLYHPPLVVSSGAMLQKFCDISLRHEDT